MIAGLGMGWDGMGWDDGKTYVSTWDEDDDGVGGWVGGKAPNGKYPLFFIEVYLLAIVYWSVYSIVSSSSVSTVLYKYYIIFYYYSRKE